MIFYIFTFLDGIITKYSQFSLFLFQIWFKVYGKNNRKLLKTNEKQIITISNHVFDEDYIRSSYTRTGYILV